MLSKGLRSHSGWRRLPLQLVRQESRESLEATRMRESEQIDVGRSSLDKSSGTRGDSTTKWRISSCGGASDPRYADLLKRMELRQ